MNDYSYVGSELELFRHAHNWKTYLGNLVRNYLGPDVLEVGAGIGASTEVLCQGDQSSWVCLEPDPVLAKIAEVSIINGALAKCCQVQVGTLASLSVKEAFDSILYIDVLEHIENDQLELRLAADRLKKDGFLIILAPAHQWLFTPFDKAVGHHRRYNKRSLSAVAPPDLRCVRLFYLDCIGLAASLSNRFILKSRMPTKKQILFWDRAMVPLSVKIDPLIRYSLGKSVIGIWQKKL